LEKSECFYILFTTIHEVLKAEKILKEQMVDVEIVPVPRSLSSDCGVCLKSKADVGLLASLLGSVEGVKCYLFDGVEYRPGRRHGGGGPG
jgi:hypothetical protein